MYGIKIPKKKDKKLFKKKKFNRFLPKDVKYLDYKNVDLLSKFINKKGQIISAAASGVTARQQRVIARAIKRARQMALLPYSFERIRH